jgi:hypothetical protein
MRLVRTLCVAAISLLLWVGLFSVASLARAETLQWQTQLNAITYEVNYYAARYGPFGTGALTTRCQPTTVTAALRPTVQVTYSLQVTNGNTGEILPCGSTHSVPQGTVLRYQFFPHVSSDIHWFAGTAQSEGLNIDSSYESHYGQWSSSLSGAVSCRDPAATSDTMYSNVYVAPPDKSLSGVESFACSGAADDQTCTATTPGMLTPTFNIAATPGVFHMTRNAGRCPGSIEPPPGYKEGCAPLGNVASFTVPSQTLACPITVTPTLAPEEAEMHAPSVPSLSSGGACVMGTPHTINFVSTDPDSDNIRYGIDWDGDGSINEWVPPSGYVASGASQTASRTYSLAGDKTIKVMAQDEGGLSSDWAALTFSCAEPPAPAGQCSDNADNDSDGLIDSLDPDCTATAGLSEFPQGQQPAPPLPSVDLTLRVLPSLVGSGRTTKVHWSATGFASCRVSAPNGDSWESFASPVGGETSSPITGQTTYTLACIDSAGLTVTRTATVRTVPLWRER